jgi:hypothetical protein
MNFIRPKSEFPKSSQVLIVQHPPGTYSQFFSCSPSTFQILAVVPTEPHSLWVSDLLISPCPNTIATRSSMELWIHLPTPIYQPTKERKKTILQMPKYSEANRVSKNSRVWYAHLTRPNSVITSMPCVQSGTDAGFVCSYLKRSISRRWKCSRDYEVGGKKYLS